MADEKKVGRPKIEIDEELLYKLATIHCTMKEMVAIIGVSEDTLKRNFAGIIDKGKAEGNQRNVEGIIITQWETRGTEGKLRNKGEMGFP